MARLPGEQDLGQTPQAAAARPVADYSAGGEALAAGGRQLGAGVSKLGEGIGEFKLDQGRWDYAKAHSYLLTGLVDRNAATTADTNYGPDETGKSLPNRHADQVTSLRNDAAALIRDPAMRERFVQDTMPTVQRSLEQASAHAKSLENNANVAWASEQGNKIMDQAITAPDEETRRQLIDSHNQLIDGLVARGSMTPLQAVSAKQTWAQHYATASLLARADTDPQGVINEMRSIPGSGADVTNRILKIEGTGKNPSSSASGPGQFVDETWLNTLKKNRPDLANGRSDAELLELKGDKALGRQMTEALRGENEAYLTNRGLPATPGNQYLAHFLGPAGATAVIKADPNKPVAEVLAAAVGEKKAAAMIEANPKILQGQLAGSVKQWSDGLMGGSAPGGGSLRELLRPDVREHILAQAVQQQQKRDVQDLTDFRRQVEDTTAEAMRTGAVAKPLTRGDFIAKLGADAGPKEHQQYEANLQLGRDAQSVAGLDEGEQNALLQSYTPQAGSGFADAAKRQDTLAKAIAQVRTARAKDPDFKARIDSSIAEAARTGKATSTVSLAEFQGRLGVDDGTLAYNHYRASLRLGRDVQSVGELSPPEQLALLQSYAPEGGAADFADMAKRKDALAKAIAQSNKEKADDPAAFVINRMPASAEAYKAFSAALSDPTATEDTRKAAARDFATKVEMEQARIGVPAEARRIVPQGYIDNLTARLTDPKSAGGTLGLVEQLQRESELWGDRWPQIYRHMGEAGPAVRVIGSGVQPTAGRILSELNGVKFADILKDENAEKAGTIKKDVLDAFKPLAASMAGNEGMISVFNDFRGQAEKLAAYYVVRGSTSSDAAQQAWKELVGHKYDFGATYRVPKSAGIEPRDAAVGVLVASDKLDTMDIAPMAVRTPGVTDEYRQKETIRRYQRDGQWVTAPDESGLMLIYQDTAVRTNAGRPLIVPWDKLKQLSKDPSVGGGFDGPSNVPGMP